MTTYTDSDMVSFYSTYGYNCYPQCPGWVSYDFGKHGLDQAQTKHATYTPASATVSQAANCSFLVKMTMMEPNLYGAPDQLWFTLNLGADSVITMQLNLYNKIATRMPEAHWLSFQPMTYDGGKWYINKVAQDYLYDNVVKNGTMHFHGHWSGVKYKTPKFVLDIESMDTGVVAVGSRNPFPTPLTPADPTGGMHFNLFNNIWGLIFQSI